MIHSKDTVYDTSWQYANENVPETFKYPFEFIVNIHILSFYTVVGSWAQTCESPQVNCDFVCDCSECSDEQDCGTFKSYCLNDTRPCSKCNFNLFNCYCFLYTSQGYKGKEFQCDFEDAGMCGWMDKSLNTPEYMWERRQRGQTLSDSGPSSDYTTGTATGTLSYTLTCPSFTFNVIFHLNVLKYML